MKSKYASQAERWTDDAYADADAYLAHRAELIIGLGPGLEAGDSVILLVRELRDVTGKTLREVESIVRDAPAPIREALSLKEAKALKRRIEDSGARAEVREREASSVS